MACPHSDGPDCPKCTATLESDAGEGTLLRPDESTGDTLIRGRAGDDELLRPGQTIGRYVVLDHLGQGGMGVVYTARDPRLERVVAVKVLRSSASAGQARLLREAQAMAQLAHPNVVPVYDSGPWGAGVFVVMELVRGSTLDTWMKQQPRGWREVVSLFVEAGRGLEAAHARGLIHRDFKPANVLVGEDGRPRVTDFGLARVASTPSSDEVPAQPAPDAPVPSLETPLTQAGTLMGSPGYMALEQYVGAETTAATDQFSFCVSLYEALYGQRPFVAKTIPELQALTAQGVVSPPPGRAVPGWLHRVVVRGLSPRPEARHPSMSALLRALRDDPGLRRRRWYAVAAAAAVLTTAVGATWWTGARARQQACQGAAALLDGVWDDAVKARAEQAFLATGLPFAAPTWAATRESLDAWARQWVAARTDACEATRVRGENTERQLLLRVECLEQRRVELGALAEAFGTADRDLVTSASSAASRLTPLEPCANLKQLEDRRAPPPELAGQARELAQQISQARALSVAGRATDALPRLTAASERAATLKLPALESEARESLGELQQTVRDFAAARASFEGALRAAEVAGDDAQAARVLSRLVSLVGWRLERPDEARTWAALAGGVVERIGGDRLLEARVEEGLGDTEWQAGRRALSLDAYRRSLALLLQAQGPESADVARLRSSVGWVLTEQGELAAARTELEQSRALREKLLGPGHPALAESFNELSMLALEQRDLDGALSYEKRALDVLTPLAQPARLRAARVSYGAVLVSAGRVDEGLALLEQERPALEQDLQQQTPLFVYQHAQVEALTRLGRPAEALSRGRVWLAEQERVRGKQHPQVATLADRLSEAAFDLGQWDQAVDGAERYLASRAAIGGVDSPRTGETLLRSAQAHLALGKPLEATSRAERALAALSRGVLSRGLRGEARRALAEALLRSGGDPARAAELLQQAREDAQSAGDDRLLERIAKTK